MRARWTIAIAAFALCCIPATAGRIVIDADDFLPGTDVTHAIPGVTLTFSGGARFPGTPDSTVTYVRCGGVPADPDIYPRPPACDINSFGVAYHLPEIGQGDPPILFIAAFDAPFHRIIAHGVSTSGSLGIAATHVLDFNPESSGSNPPGYEQFAIPQVGGVSQGAVHAADFTFSAEHSVLYIGSFDAFFPTRIVAFFVPASPHTWTASIALLFLTSVAARRKRTYTQ